MNDSRLRRTAAAALLGLLIACPSLRSQSTDSVQEVLKQDDKVLALQNGQTQPLTKEVVFPNAITVLTNGTFTVNDGDPRELKEGQRLRRDGLLLSPDGSVTPVFDHIAVIGGKVMIMKAGQMQPLTCELVLADGSRVKPDGTMLSPKGRLSRLIDGHRLKLDGSALKSQDAVTLKDGQVWIQKDGSVFRMQGQQSLTMNDGSKVFGDGTLVARDGKRRKLSEGETVLIAGPALKLP